MRGRLVIVLAAGMLMGVPLSAHHGGAVFDVGKSVTLKGTVTQWVYSNPHLLLMLDVKGEDGTVVKWVAETQAPSVMYPAGYRKDSFKAGDEVSVTVQPAQNGRPIGRILKVITANGTTLGLTGEAPIYPPGR